MTKKFVESIWGKNWDDDPEAYKECIADYYKDRKEALSCIKVGSILANDLHHYGDMDEFQITKINKKTGEITVEFHGGVPGI